MAERPAFSWALRGYGIDRLVPMAECHRSCQAREAQRLSCNAVLGVAREMLLIIGLRQLCLALDNYSPYYHTDSNRHYAEKDHQWSDPSQ